MSVAAASVLKSLPEKIEKYFIEELLMKKDERLLSKSATRLNAYFAALTRESVQVKKVLMQAILEDSEFFFKSYHYFLLANLC